MVCFLLLTAFYWFYTVDDAYISFRYAQNLATGQGLVFNPGEYVEGYSNPSWVLLTAIAIRIGVDPVISVKLLGLLCSLVTIFIVYRLHGIGDPSRPRSAVSWGALLSCNVSFALWSVAGLETPLYSCLIVAAIYLFLCAATPARYAWSAVAFALTALTRPEGAAFWGITLLWCVLTRLHSRRWNTRELMYFIAPFVIVFGSFLVWRYAYYGALLPNTVLAKSGSTTWVQHVNRGLLDLYFATKQYALAPLLLPLYLLLDKRQDKTAQFTLFVYVLALFAFIIGLGGDWMPLFRLLTPVLPLAAVLIGAGVERLIGQFPIQNLRGGRVAIVALFVLPGIIVNLPLALLSRYAGDLWWLAEPGIPIRGSGTADYYQPLGLFLQSRGDPNDWLAVDEAGALPYYSRLPTLDYWGLTDRTVARILESDRKTFIRQAARGRCLCAVTQAEIYRFMDQLAITSKTTRRFRPTIATARLGTDACIRAYTSVEPEFSPASNLR
jgi:hypothetical protein